MKVKLRNAYFTATGALLLPGEHDLPDNTPLPRSAKVIEGKRTAKAPSVQAVKKD